MILNIQSIFPGYTFELFFVMHFITVAVSEEVWGSELHGKFHSMLHTYVYIRSVKSHVETIHLGNSEVFGKQFTHLLFPYLQLITLLSKEKENTNSKTASVL